MPVARASRKRASEPAWEVALLYPDQGDWTEDDYLELTESTNRMMELSDGCLEVLTMPTTSHQRIVAFIFGLLSSFVRGARLGEVLPAPLRIRLWEGKIREPDIVFMLAKHSKRVGEKVWDGADLVMEVVSGSPEDRERDLVKKKTDYARGGVAEYWIIDPEESRIRVLRLSGKRYVTDVDVSAGEIAASVLLRGFEVRVDDVWAAAKGN